MQNRVKKTPCFIKGKSLPGGALSLVLRNALPTEFAGHEMRRAVFRIKPEYYPVINLSETLREMLF
jgi:hypothetical protein